MSGYKADFEVKTGVTAELILRVIFFITCPFSLWLESIY